MTNFTGGQKGAIHRTRPTPAAALRIQSAVNGTPRPFGWGQARIAGNILWYGNFVPTLVSSGGGKGLAGGGGAKSGGGAGTYVYATGVAMGLCEGPIDSVQQGWENKSSFLLGSGGPGFALFDGDYQQLPWPWLQTYQVPSAQAFRGIAYEANGSFYLGTSAELPNMTWDVRFAISGALGEVHVVPSTSAPAIAASFFDYDYGVVGHYTIPYAGAYTVEPSESARDQSGAVAQIANSDAAWFGSNSCGVVWDAGASDGTPGQPLALVTGTPSTGQYALDSVHGIFTFAAADAGQPVVIIDAALAPGVYYVHQATGNLTAGSAIVTGLSTLAGIGLGSRVMAGADVPVGAFVTFVSGGSATGNTASGSITIANVSGSFTAASGTPITDGAGVLPSGTTVASVTAPVITLSAAPSTAAAGVAITISVTYTGDLADNQIVNLSGTAGIVAGALITDSAGAFSTSGVASLSGTTVTLPSHTGEYVTGDSFTFTTQITAGLQAGSASLLAPSSTTPLVAGAVVEDAYGFLPGGTTIASVTAGSITLSAAATAAATGDQLNFGSAVTLSQAASATATGATLTFRGAALAQVLSAPAQGEFTLSVQASSFGTYTFNAADAGASVLIMDSPDANPADVVVDFLTNPYYGLTQFPPARIGDLSTYRSYCLAAGLLVSPTITTQGAANQFLQDLMKATNSEIVWAGGQLTIVPFGDTALAANGATYTPPSAPLYSLDDDDFLVNQGTNPHSVASAASPDPVTVTRLDPATQENQISVEYLDRGNIYNPTIVEAKDDAAIETFGLKSNGSKQLHMFCAQSAALASAQLMLGRQQVRRTFSFTLGREYILLDPMDIIAITDGGAGLSDQWVRIREITENDDRTLSIVAEEYLQGTGSAPLYGHQSPAGHVPNYDTPAPNVLSPVIFDAPVQIGNVLGMESIIATNGSGPNYGGCDVWLSSDNVNFKYAGTLWGGTTMGVLSASFASGSDPDTADTLAVDLTSTRGVLNGGTQADADSGNTLCLVDSELVTYEQATLTGQWKYSLGKNGSTPGYLRRGFYGTAIAAHAAGAPFVRLRAGTYFTVSYDAADIGSTIHVKFLAFNPWGGGKQTLDQVTSYAHTLAPPPQVASGLLAGVIQTPDLALNAATAQLTVSAAGPITLPVGPTTATLVSGSLTTTGALVQIAYNAQFTNPSSSAVTVIWRLTYQGIVVLDTASIAIQPGATVTVAKQTTYTPGAQTGLFAFIAEMQSSVSPAATSSYIDLSVTELRR